jgi:hypothetical protein
MEGHRRASWLHHKVNEAVRTGSNDAFRRLLDVKPEVLHASAAFGETGWPPGDAPENYRVTGVSAPESVADVPDLSGTLLGQVLAKRGVRI